MKLLKELELQFDDPLWAYDPELAMVDAMLNLHPELHEIISADILALGKNNEMGRQDGPAVEQVVRAALYKELKGLNYQELEYAQIDSRICPLFIKLGVRDPFSYEVLHKYITAVRPESLQKLMVEINKVALAENFEAEGPPLRDASGVREDSTVVETNIHYPTNNALIWDCIRVSQRILGKLRKIDQSLEEGVSVSRAKKNFYQINVSKKAEEREQLFAQQLKTLKRCIEQTAKALKKLHGNGKKANRQTRKLCQRLEELLPKMTKVYSMASRKELFGQPVPKEEKLFSIFEDHTDIIIKGSREVQFGHKVDLAVGRKGMILVCQVAEGNPSDHSFYPKMLDQLEKNCQVTPRDLATDGGYASLDNQQLAQKRGVVNIVFNKIVGSLKNVVSSASVEMRLKKWRSGIEAVISNWKRGFQMFRCEWKGRVRFEAKVLWSMLAYNFRVMTRVALRQITA
jgi:IS5 family transposase